MVNIGVGGSREQFALGVESEREILSQSSTKHTSGLDIKREALKNRVKATLMLVDDVDEAYQQWADEIVSPDTVLSLVEDSAFADSDFPAWMADIKEAIEDEREDHAEDDDKSLDDFGIESARQIVEDRKPSAKTKWDAYNDLTENIWHNERSGDTTKRRKVRALHRSMDPLEQARNGN